MAILPITSGPPNLRNRLRVSLPISPTFLGQSSTLYGGSKETAQLRETIVNGPLPWHTLWYLNNAKKGHRKILKVVRGHSLALPRMSQELES